MRGANIIYRTFLKIQFKVLFLTYKVLHSLLPGYLRDCLFQQDGGLMWEIQGGDWRVPILQEDLDLFIYSFICLFVCLFTHLLCIYLFILINLLNKLLLNFYVP